MLNGLRVWLKNSDSMIAKAVFSFLKAVIHFELPSFRFIYSPLYHIHSLIHGVISNFIRIFYWTPLFKSRLKNNPKQLNLYSGMPLLLGPLNISMGNRCRMSGHTTISGRTSKNIQPVLIIGNNVGISWQNEIFVGDRIEIGNNVRLAVKVRLVGYPGHPIDPESRAKGHPDSDHQVGNIVLEDDVWLTAGVTVMGGVRIGRGTIVTTGSVVTKDLPPGVLAGGMPAKVIRPLKLTDNRPETSYG
ncbi:acetyltransferase [Endozoicomonas sp. (ex Bugula neritina AB1)]|nr:acetyltransferase [Endozoicomonas sp. (ex Bugula neritina AB1)]